MLTIPNSWDAWAKTLIGGMVSGGANAGLAALGISGANAVGINVKPLDLKELGAVCLSGAIVGALMFLAKSPVPPDTSNTQLLYRQQGLANPPAVQPKADK